MKTKAKPNQVTKQDAKKMKAKLKQLKASKVSAAKLPEPENAQCVESAEGSATPVACAPNSKLIQASRNVDWYRSDIECIQQEIKNLDNNRKYLVNNLERSHLHLVQALETLKGLM